MAWESHRTFPGGDSKHSTAAKDQSTKSQEENRQESTIKAQPEERTEPSRGLSLESKQNP